MEKRYIRIDLHRNRFTCCIRLENERTYVTEWALENLAAGKIVNRISVDERTRKFARVALDRMLSLR